MCMLYSSSTLAAAVDDAAATDDDDNGDDDDGVKISEGGCPLIESWDDGQRIRGSLAKIAKAQMMGRCSGN